MSTDSALTAIAVELEGAEGAVGRFQLTGLARGPWQDDAAHGGAPAALIARAAEAHCDDGKLRVGSLNMAFSGPVLLGEIEVESRVLKPGRRQKVIQISLSVGGRNAIEARAVLIRRGEVDLPEAAVSEPEMLPDRAQARPVDQNLWAFGENEAFHRTTNTVLALEGGPDRTEEKGSGWFHLEYPLIEGETLTGAQRAAAAADFGNGLAHPVAFGEFLFVNCDLNLALLREPVGEWIGLRSRTEVDSGGAGVTTTELFDDQGRCGSATQFLYVDRV